MDLTNALEKVRKEVAIKRKMKAPIITDDAVRFEFVELMTRIYLTNDQFTDNRYASENGLVTDNDWKVISVNVDIDTDKKALYKGSLNGTEAGILMYDINLNIIGFIHPPATPVNVLKFDIPKETKLLRASYYKNGTDALPFVIEAFDNNPVNITPLVANANDFFMEQKRIDLTGISTEVASAFVLTGTIKDLVKEIVNEYGLYSKARIDIYKRKNSGNLYDLQKEVFLDFQAYSESKDVIEVHGLNYSLQEIINSGRSIKYDIPIDDTIRESKKWMYNRINMQNTLNYTIPEGQQNPSGQLRKLTFPVFHSSSELISNRENENLDIRSQPMDNYSPNNYMVKFGFYKDVLNFEINISLRIRSGAVSIGEGLPIKLVALNNGIETIIKSWYAIYNPDPSDLYYHLTVEETVTTTIKKDDTLQLVMGEDSYDWAISNFIIDSAETFRIYWQSKGEPIELDIISPEKLLQRFLDLISGIPNKYTAEVQWNETCNLMLCAAETVRNFPNPTLHISMKDLMEWFQVMGYEREYYDTRLVYKQRDYMFDPVTVAVKLEKYHVKSFNKIATTEFAYTGVESGYEKQNYESANGKYEVNGTFSYKTEYESSNDNVLSLISPYRGDSIGIELLCWTRGEQSTDTRSDNDVFVVALQEKTDYYEVDRQYPVIVENIELFNGIISPYHIAKRNDRKIGINTRSIQFTGTDCNRDAVMQNADLFGNITTDRKYFEPYQYVLLTGNRFDLPLRPYWNGLVEFEYDKTIYRGYIRDIKKYYTRNRETDWTIDMVK